MGVTAIDDLLKEIAAIGGVAGALVFSGDGHIEAARPSTLAGSPGQAVGGLALRALASLAAVGPVAPDELDLSFEKGRLVVRSVGPDSALVIVCQPSINAMMLKLQTAAAVKALAAARVSGPRTDAPGTAARVAEALESALGEKAAKFSALASAAGESKEKLAAAGAEAVRFAKLFLGKDRAEALGTRLGEILGREI